MYIGKVEKLTCASIAGSDTTATQIAANLFYITQNPETKARLTLEIRSTFDSLEEIVLGKQLDSCNFLKAVVQETLRITPSLPGILSRQVQEGGVTVLGHYFAQGTELAVPVYALHHNEEYFPENHVHKPDRWQTDSKAYVERAQTAFQPFSYGSRQCIGKRLAYIELYIFLARIMWLYDVKYLGKGREEAWGPDVVEYKMIDHIAAARVGPVIEFTRRQDV